MPQSLVEPPLITNSINGPEAYRFTWQNCFVVRFRGTNDYDKLAISLNDLLP